METNKCEEDISMLTCPSVKAMTGINFRSKVSTSSLDISITTLKDANDFVSLGLGSESHGFPCSVLEFTFLQRLNPWSLNGFPTLLKCSFSLKNVFILWNFHLLIRYRLIISILHSPLQHPPQQNSQQVTAIFLFVSASDTTTLLLFLLYHLTGNFFDARLAF